LFAEGFFNGSAESHAAFGSLQVHAEYHGQIGPDNPNGNIDYAGNALAAARFSDTLTVSHANLNGTTGYLVYALDVVGGGSLATTTTAASMQAGLVVTLRLIHDADFAPAFQTDQYSLQDNGSVFARPLSTVALPFEFGRPFDLVVSLEAAAGSSLLDNFNTVSDGILDFTTTLSGIQVLDSTQQTVSGVSIQSASGTAYPVPRPVPVPESVGDGILALSTCLLAIVVTHSRTLDLKRTRPARPISK
jgi:hypothetical protein